MKMLNNIHIVVVVAVVLFWAAFIGVFIANENFNLPIVFWSYSENRCVSVIKVIDDKEVKCKCDDLDYKYERVWVK